MENANIEKVNCGNINIALRGLFPRYTIKVQREDEGTGKPPEAPGPRWVKSSARGHLIPFGGPRVDRRGISL